MKGQRGDGELGCIAALLLAFLLLWGMTLVVNGHAYHFVLRIGN